MTRSELQPTASEVSQALRPPSNRLVLANAAVKALAAGLAFALQIALVKLLGPADYGAYVLFVTYCAALSILGKGGLEYSILRYFAVAHSSGETHRLRSIRNRALAYATGFSLLAVGLGQLLRLLPNLPSALTKESTALWTVPAVVSLSLMFVLSGMLRGMRRVLLAEGLDSLIRPLALLVIALVGTFALSLGGFDAGVIAFVGSNILVGIAILVAVNAVLARSGAERSSRQQAPQPAAQPSPFRPRAALVLVASGLLSYGLFQFDTLLVGFYLGDEAVASYAMACNFVRIVIFAAMIISAQSQPLIAAAFGSGRRAAVRHITLVALRNSVAAALVGVIILAVLGRLLLRMVSPGFAEAYPTLVVLSGAHLANTLVIVLSGMLVMCRREAVVMWAQVVGLAICVPLLFVLVPRLGRVGAAVAVLAGLVVVLCIVMFRSRDVLWSRGTGEPVVGLRE